MLTFAWPENVAGQMVERHHICAPGDMFAGIEGLGVAVRHSDGRTILFHGWGMRQGLPVELDALKPQPHWQAACV